MQSNAQATRMVAVVGAGPAGLFATKQLANEGIEVVLLNRDIKPGGLAEYGIYPDKLKMKEGLRAQFHQILDLPNVHYFGNVTVGERGDLSLADLRELGFQAVLVTTGAQGTKWLGMPGEQLRGVYHAKDLVYHYNFLPPYSEHSFAIGRRVAVVGVGNVMLDITHYLASQRKVDQVIAVARRGPVEVKFEKKELEAVVAYLDMPALQAELARVQPVMQQAGQDAAPLLDLVHAAQQKAALRESGTQFSLRFLSSPVRILDDGRGGVGGLVIENNTLRVVDGNAKADGLGTTQVLDVDTVIFAIGDCVDPGFGLPCNGSEFYKNPEQRFPVEGISYEVIDPVRGAPLEGTFVAGWARRASAGLVGIARKDGVNGARAVLQYLETLHSPPVGSFGRVDARISQFEKPVITQFDLTQLEQVERQQAEALGVEDFKFSTNIEMLQAIEKEKC